MKLVQFLVIITLDLTINAAHESIINVSREYCEGLKTTTMSSRLVKRFTRLECECECFLESNCTRFIYDFISNGRCYCFQCPPHLTGDIDSNSHTDVE